MLVVLGAVGLGCWTGHVGCRSTFPVVVRPRSLAHIRPCSSLPPPPPTQTSDLLARSEANKELNDKKRLATSYANLARSRTVSDGTCKFPKVCQRVVACREGLGT